MTSSGPETHGPAENHCRTVTINRPTHLCAQDDAVGGLNARVRRRLADDIEQPPVLLVHFLFRCKQAADDRVAATEQRKARDTSRARPEVRLLAS